AVDVFEKEPCAPDHPLFAFDNVIVTPHIAASTTEAQESVAISIAEQVVEYLTRGVARGAVNMPSAPVELLQRLQPYSVLAEKLGALQAQLCDGGIERVTIEYKGDVANESVALITPALLKGLLAPILEGTVNNVNAPVIAKERGIEVKEVRSRDAGEFTSLIRVVVDAAKKSATVAGTLFGRKDPRVVEVNSFKVDFDPRGHLLFILNEDQPGVIGMVGRILGEHGINIARMECARVGQGGVALLILALDSQTPDVVLDAIKSSTNIQSAKCLQL
ncbi:MAG TPA: ACT domain-containing protein, partial [Nitrospirales bacterium]|nr:ACT domain-containing protein [Nitrospirales bacterium]